MRGMVDYKRIYNLDHICSVFVISLISLYYLESSYTAVSYYHLAVNDLLGTGLSRRGRTAHFAAKKIIVEFFGNQMPNLEG